MNTEAVAKWAQLMGKPRHRCDNLAPLFSSIETVEQITSGEYVEEERDKYWEEYEEKERLQQEEVVVHPKSKTLPSMRLFEESSDEESETHIPSSYETNIFSSNISYLKRKNVKHVYYEASPDIEKIPIEEDLNKFKNDRVRSWKYLVKNINYYSRTRYRFSTYCEVLNDYLERELLLRTKITYIWKEGKLVEYTEDVITKWEGFEVVDYTTKEGLEMYKKLTSDNIYDESIDTELLNLFKEYQELNNEDALVLNQLKKLLIELNNILIKASQSIQAIACYKRVRSEQEHEMREVCASKTIIDQLLQMKRVDHSVNYDDELYIAGIETKSIVLPHKDWIWEILYSFVDPSVESSGNVFGGISFQKNSTYVKDLNECSVIIFMCYIRLYFLINIGNIKDDKRCGNDFYHLSFEACREKHNIESNSLEKDHTPIMQKTGSCPILEVNVPVTEYDLNTTMLSITELNTTFYEVPLSEQLIDYVYLLFGRYTTFSWFLYVEDETMNNPAYSTSTLLNSVDTNGEKETIKHQHVNRMFMNYGWNMLFPVMKDISLCESMNYVFQKVVYTNSVRSENKECPFDEEMYRVANEWGVDYVKNETARLGMEDFKSDVLQYFMRPGEYTLFKLKHNRSEPVPFNIINNMRPHDMDRINTKITEGLYSNVLKNNIFPLKIKDSEFDQVIKQQELYKKTADKAIESLLDVEGLTEEWIELLKITQDTHQSEPNSKIGTSARGPEKRLMSIDKALPYGVRIAQDYYIVSLIKVYLTDKYFDSAVILKERVHQEMCTLLSRTFRTKVVNVSTKYVLAHCLRNKPPSCLISLSEIPLSVIIQLCGGYSVCWFRGKCVIHCDSFLEAVYYLSCCRIVETITECLYDKLTNADISHTHSHDEYASLKNKIEDTMKDISLMSECNQSELLDTSDIMIKFNRENVSILLGICELILYASECNTEQLPPLWENVIVELNTWYTLIVSVFRIESKQIRFEDDINSQSVSEFINYTDEMYIFEHMYENDDSEDEETLYKVSEF